MEHGRLDGDDRSSAHYGWVGIEFACRQEAGSDQEGVTSGLCLCDCADRCRGGRRDKIKHSSALANLASCGLHSARFRIRLGVSLGKGFWFEGERMPDIFD